MAEGTTKKLTDAQIVAQISRYREEAYERDYVIRDRWLQCYALYRNKADFADKAPWQSRLMFSKAFAAVKQLTANLLRLLMSSEQWVTVEPGESNPDLVSMAPYVETTVLKLANNAGVIAELRDGLEFGGCIGLGVIKGEWRYDTRNDVSINAGKDGSSETPQNPTIEQKSRKEGRLALTSVDPFHMWFGPRSKGGRDFDWTIEESYADLAALKAEKGFENLDDIEGSSIDSTDITRSYDKARKDKRDVPETARRSVHLLEFYGDIVNPDTNEIVETNQHIIVANRKTVIKHEDNQYWDGLPPYIAFSPLVVAGRFPGQGVIEMSLSLLNETNKVAQQMGDHVSFSVVPMLEIEATALENAEGDIQTGVQPGKVFYRRAGAQTAVTPLQMPQLSNQAFNYQSMLDHELQRSTFISETVQGLTDAKGETTATEVNATQQQSSVLISDIGLTIEGMLLAPLAEMIWSRAFQFIDSTSKPTWSELVGNVQYNGQTVPVGKALDEMPREQRIALIQGRYKFTAHGLSRAIQRNQSAQQLLGFLQTVAQGGQTFIPLVNMPAIFARYFQALHLPEPQQLLAPNVDEAMAAQQAGILANADPQAKAQAAASAQAQQQAHTADAQGGQKAMQTLLEHVLSLHKNPNDAQPAPKEATPSESIGYLNLPPAGRVQMAKKAGIILTLEEAAFNPAPPKKEA